MAALAAGVNLILSPENSIACSRWGMLAPDGRCKTFDVVSSPSRHSVPMLWEDDIDVLPDSASSVLDEMFDSAEAAPAGSESGIR